MNAEAVDLILEKNPLLKEARSQLEALQKGAYCLHQSWGFGKVIDYDAINNRLIIDFDAKKGHSMDPSFCFQKLEILPEDNIFVRFKKDKDMLKDLVKNHPVDLVIEILKTTKKGIATQGELENILMRLLGEGPFRKFWYHVGPLLTKDARIAVPKKKNKTYILREQPIPIEQEILEEFYLNRQPLKKIQLAEKLLQLSSSVKAIADDLPRILEELTDAIQLAQHLNPGERLYGCWVRNDLARALEMQAEQLAPTAPSLLLETQDISRLVEELPASYYRRFLELIVKVYPDNWQDLSFQLLKNSVGKFTNDCLLFLLEKGEEAQLNNCLKRWLHEQTLKSSLLFWIVRNRNNQKYHSLIAPLLNAQLLKTIFYSVEVESLNSTGNRRIPLADLVNNDKELIRDLLVDANVEIARDLAQTLLINQGFENLTKRSLIARFIRQFPSIQKLLVVESEKQSEALMVSQESMELRKQEYEELTSKKIPQNKIAIAQAREHGDLRENAEYKMARQDQDALLARKAQLEEEMSRAQVIDFNTVLATQVGIGTFIEIKDELSGTHYHYTILGAWDSDPEKNILSYKSPLAQNLIGKKVGETITIRLGTEEFQWTIQKIMRWVDHRHV